MRSERVMAGDTKPFGMPTEHTVQTLLRIHALTLHMIDAARGAIAEQAPGCGCAAGMEGIRRQLAELESTVAACREEFLEEWRRTAQGFLDDVYARARHDLRRVLDGEADRFEAEPADKPKRAIH